MRTNETPREVTTFSKTCQISAAFFLKNAALHTFLHNMAPKSKSGAGNVDLKQEDILQAVVFADSFNNNFSPISHDRPRVNLL